MADSEQLNLIDVLDLSTTMSFKSLDLESLPVEEHLPPPSKALITSIRIFGVIDPIHVVEHYVCDKDLDCRTEYTIIAGHRRVAAARIADLVTIPCCIYETVNDATSAVMALQSNALRSRNAVDELNNILSLSKQGYSESDIAKTTGMAVGTIRKRLALKSVDPSILEAVCAGTIAVGTAESIAKLPNTYQKALAEKLEEEGKITGSDVKQVGRERKQVAMSTLDDRLFANTADRSEAVINAARETAKFYGTGEIAFANALERLVEAVSELDN